MLALTVNVNDLTGLSTDEDVYIAGYGLPTGPVNNIMALNNTGNFSQVAATITGTSWLQNVATITTAVPHQFNKGDKVFVSGNLDATPRFVVGYNGYFKVTNVTPTTFEYSCPVAPSTTKTFGTAYAPGIVQKSTIVSCALSGNFVTGSPNNITVTTSVPHGLVGQTIQLSGIKEANGNLILGFNGFFSNITIISPKAFMFQYADETTAPPVAVTGGTVRSVSVPAIEVSKLAKSIQLDTAMTNYSGKFIIYVSKEGATPVNLPFMGDGVTLTNPATAPYAPPSTPVNSVFDIVEFAYLPWGATSSGTTATITTTSPHGLSINDSVSISGVTTSGYNTPTTPPQTYVSVLTVPSPNQFTYTLPSPGTNLSKSGSGTVTPLSTNIAATTISNGYSTFDVSAVDGLGIPMNIKADTVKALAIKSVGVRIDDPTVTRYSIGTAFTSFMKKDPLGISANMKRLLYNSDVTLAPVKITAASWSNNSNQYTISSSVSNNLKPKQNDWITITGITPAAYSGTFQVSTATGTTFSVTSITNLGAATLNNAEVATMVFMPPASIDNQFFNILAPKNFLINATTILAKDPMVTFWDSTVQNFFASGNQISIYLGKDIMHPTYTGTADGTNYTLSNGDNTYVISPYATATATINAGSVTAVPIGSGGSGYAVAPTVNFSGGGGSGATATASISNGVVTKLTIVKKGTGYTSPPTVTLTGIPATPSTANWTFVWPQPIAGTSASKGDMGLLEGQIMAALCRGVALDGVYTSSMGAMPANFSTIAWGVDPAVWYTQHKSTAFPGFDSIYCPYSKFLHQSDINGNVFKSKASKPIFLHGAAYGFGMDENPIMNPYGITTASWDATDKEVTFTTDVENKLFSGDKVTISGFSGIPTGIYNVTNTSTGHLDKTKFTVGFEENPLGTQTAPPKFNIKFSNWSAGTATATFTCDSTTQMAYSIGELVTITSKPPLPQSNYLVSTAPGPINQFTVVMPNPSLNSSWTGTVQANYLGSVTYNVPLVPSKLDGTIPDDTVVTITLAPWDSGTATVPGAPTSVKAFSVGNESLYVKWIAPTSTGGSAITDYLVKYSSNGGSTWTNFVHSASIVPSLTVTGMTNGTSYVIKVIAKNKVGSSPPSDNSAPAKPGLPGSPKSVSATIVTSSSTQVNVTWTAPANTGGPSITGYTVKYWKNVIKGGAWVTVNSVPTAPTTTNFLVTNLTPGSQYTFQVIAINSFGNSVGTNSIMVTMPSSSLAAALAPTFGAQKSKTK